MREIPVATNKATIGLLETPIAPLIIIKYIVTFMNWLTKLLWKYFKSSIRLGFVRNPKPNRLFIYQVIVIARGKLKILGSTNSYHLKNKNKNITPTSNATAIVPATKKTKIFLDSRNL